MRHQLPIRQYHIVKLARETGWVVSTADDLTYVDVPDESTQSELDAIDQVALAHDPSLLPEEIAEIARKQIADASKTSRESIPLIKAFNDAAQALMINALVDLLQGKITLKTFDRIAFNESVYRVWRQIFEMLDPDIKIRFITYHAIHFVDFPIYPEPEVPSPEYMASFNRAISGTLGYMADLAQM